MFSERETKDINIGLDCFLLISRPLATDGKILEDIAKAVDVKDFEVNLDRCRASCRIATMSS